MEAGHDRTASEAGQDGTLHRGIPCLAGRAGYTPGTIVNMLAMAGGLGRWMDARGIGPGDLDRAAVTEFRDALRAAGMRYVPAGVPGRPGRRRRALLFRGTGRGTGGALSPMACDRRGLAEATIVRYVKLARLFLSQRLTGQGGLEDLSGTDVVVFLLAESERLSVGSVKGRVGKLRSLLRFLYLQGLTSRPMGAVVPPVAGWRDTGVPKAIPAGDVQRLLDSCDRGDPVGIRDHAILMLVARLGLRSAEVARLEFGDIDWRAGQITLRKACREDGMPLPCDVGEPLAAYLSQARPATLLRQVFVAARAPMRAIPPGLVSDVTHRACDRAGLPRTGAHRLRHTLATDQFTPASKPLSSPSGSATPTSAPPTPTCTPTWPSSNELSTSPPPPTRRQDLTGPQTRCRPSWKACNYAERHHPGPPQKPTPTKRIPVTLHELGIVPGSA
jgi:integrase